MSTPEASPGEPSEEPFIGPALLAEVARRVGDHYPELYAHQTIGVAFLFSQRRAILADDMGLGKTRTAIVAAREEAAAGGPILVICPASVKLNWRREIQLVEPGADVQVLSGGASKFDPRHRWTIVNYDIVARHFDALNAQEWAVIVVDEAQYIKNRDSVRSRRILELLGVTGKPASGQGAAAYLLTGTPMTSRPRDLFNLLKAVGHPVARSYYTYAHRYCAAHHNGFGLDDQGASNLEELTMITSGVMLRRTKADVLDLPPKVRTWFPVDVPTKRVRGTEQRALDYLNAHPARAGKTWMTYLGMLNRARRELAVVKATSTADYVTDCVEDGQKVVAFTSYQAVVDILQERFGDTCVTLTGKHSARRRDAAVRRFQTDDAVRVLVGNLVAAGVGVNLTAGTHVVFNDLDWVPTNHWQAEDRVHRIGQTRTTYATYIHAPDSLDEPVAALLETKAATIATMEDAARDQASIVDEAVGRALGMRAAGVAADPAVPPRPTMGLREGLLDLLASLIGKDLSAEAGEDVIEFDSESRPGVVHTVRLVNGVAVCDCRGFEFTGNCKHVRNALRRGRSHGRRDPHAEHNGKE